MHPDNENPVTLLEAYEREVPGAAARLAERALRIALKTATGMLNDPERARDIAQDTAIDVLRNAHGIRHAETLDAWIHRIAARHTMRLIHRQRARSARETPLAELPELLEPHTADVPHDEATRRERAAALNDAMSLLPPPQRLAVVLRFVHDLSHEQVAEAMNIRPGSASALISRGTAALRTIEALEGLEDDEGLGER